MTQGIPTTESGQDMDREAKIRELAYVKWADAGEPEGDGAEFWLAAERELARREPHSVGHDGSVAPRPGRGVTG